MNTASSTPDVRALVEPIANGENHERAGLTDVGGAVPSQTRVSVTISAVSSHCCVFALSSMPMTQMYVITAIQMTPITVTATVEGLSMPKSRNEYRPAIWARFAMTMISATTIAQPVIQPVLGPNARV